MKNRSKLLYSDLKSSSREDGSFLSAIGKHEVFTPKNDDSGMKSTALALGGRSQERKRLDSEDLVALKDGFRMVNSVLNNPESE